MSRTLNVVRLQLINKQTYIWIPLIVLVGSFVLTLVIWSMIPYGGAKYGGGAQAPFWYFGIVGVQALTLTFPFSQAMSITRREFYLGTLLSAMLTSAILTAVFIVGGFIEIATGGWGLNGYFFAFDWIWDAGPAVAALFYFTMAMLFFVFGFWAATVYKRFGSLWLTVVLVGVALVLVGLLWLVGRLDAWAAVFEWFASIGAGGLTLLMAGLLIALAAIAFPFLRRAVP